MALALFQAIADNPNIRELNVRCHVSSKALAWLLRANIPTLHGLRLQLCGFGGRSGVERVSAALEANRTLQRIFLQEDTVTPGIRNSILLRLKSHPGLQELALGGDDQRIFSSWEDLAVLFERPLIKLSLHNYDFDEDNMKCLVKGLRCKETLETLSFRHVEFSDEATAVFVEYMQSRREDSSLRSLDLVRAFIHDFEILDYENLVGAMLKVPPIAGAKVQSPLPTIGSSLQHFALNGTACVGFWNVMNADTTSQIRLLSLSCSFYNDWGAMTECLPKLVHLRNLEVDWAWHQDTNPAFIRAIRRNGSIHELSLSKADHSKHSVTAASTFSENERSILKAYGKRNLLVPTLLQEPVSVEHKKMASRFPSLFAVATAAPRTAPNNVLIGLLSLDCAAGPYAAAKSNRNKTKQVR
jgi:hypothetical protein